MKWNGMAINDTKLLAISNMQWRKIRMMQQTTKSKVNVCWNIYIFLRTSNIIQYIQNSKYKRHGRTCYQIKPADSVVSVFQEPHRIRLKLMTVTVPAKHTKTLPNMVNLTDLTHTIPDVFFFLAKRWYRFERERDTEKLNWKTITHNSTLFRFFTVWIDSRALWFYEEKKIVLKTIFQIRGYGIRLTTDKQPNK